MTVAAITPEVTYLGNGTAAPLAVPFRFLAPDDLIVTRIAPGNVLTLLVRGVDYTVAGAGGLAGTVTPLAAIAVGTSWLIQRSTPHIQATDYVTGDDFPAETHELALDRLMLIVQELSRDMLTRSEVIDIIAVALVAGNGISLTRVGDTITIAVTLPGLDPATLASFVMLSGDQQGGGIGGGSAPWSQAALEELVRDTVGAALVPGTAMTITANDAANTITVAYAGGALDAELIRDTIGAALGGSALITVTPNDAADTITITTTALAPDYAGLVPTGEPVAFSFAVADNGRALDYTGAGAAATIEPEATLALPAGFATVIRNNGTGVLTVARGLGVSLKKNGGTVSADAAIAIGGTATLQRWAANDFTISGPGVS